MYKIRDKVRFPMASRLQFFDFSLLALPMYVYNYHVDKFHQIEKVCAHDLKFYTRTKDKYHRISSTKQLVKSS